VKKPQGYRQAAAETCFFLLVLCLPYYQSLLYAGITGSIYFLLMTCLLMFVLVGSRDVYRTITACLKALTLSWLKPALDRGVLWVSVPSRTVARGPSLVPSFQRPPPIFS
jgi:hypothetical protein